MSTKSIRNKASAAWRSEGSRHRAPVDSLRIGTDAEARLSVLYIDGKRLHISEEDAQRLVVAGAEDQRRHLMADD